jgi:hypothetical protein
MLKVQCIIGDLFFRIKSGECGVSTHLIVDVILEKICKHKMCTNFNQRNSEKSKRLYLHSE